MTRLLLNLAFAALLLNSACESKQEEQKTKTDTTGLPSFNLVDMNGEILDFNNFSGEVVVVDFWATWCKPCIYEIPEYNKLNKKFQGQKFKFVGLTMQSGDIPTVQAFAAEHNIQYPLYLGDREAAVAVGGVEGFPKTFVFDQSGKIVKSYLGVHPNKIHEIQGIISKLLNGEES